MGSLSNLISRVEDVRSGVSDKFRFETNVDPRAQFLEPQPQIIPKPKLKDPPILRNNFETEYRLVKRNNEVLLQRTSYEGNRVTWIDVPTIEEDDNEMA